MKNKQEELAERARYVRHGGTIDIFRPADVMELQQYALDIKDIKLYDYLEKYWMAIKRANNG